MLYVREKVASRRKGGVRVGRGGEGNGICSRQIEINCQSTREGTERIESTHRFSHCLYRLRAPRTDEDDSRNGERMWEDVGT
jgi:hypothetical protein